MNNALQPLPISASELRTPEEVARFLAKRFLNREPAVLLRYGDTGGRVLACPEPGTAEFTYLQRYLGRTVTPAQIVWLGQKIIESVASADVIGLRSDLLGPPLPPDFIDTPSDQLHKRLCELYPIRPFEQKRLDPDGARRLSETRRAMESISIPQKSILTDAWIHLGLTEIGFISSLIRNAPAFSILTSTTRRDIIKLISANTNGRLRFFECPAYPEDEQRWGGNHCFLWDRWLNLLAGMKPKYRAEPLFISAGIWTKAIAPQWAALGGISIDLGSILDYFACQATRPAVLATRYDTPHEVPAHLSLSEQFARTEKIESFI